MATRETVTVKVLRVYMKSDENCEWEMDEDGGGGGGQDGGGKMNCEKLTINFE